MAAAASKRDPPSTGAKNSTLRKTQKENEIDAIYNGHPVNLTAPPIEIYHSVFAKFRHEISLPIDNSSFTAEELTMAMELVTGSLAFHKDEDTRIKDITTAMVTLVDEQVFRRTEIMRDNGRHYKPDGCVFVQCEKFPRRDGAATAFSEVKNGVGEGGSDPIQQAQCDYVLYYSAEDVCCSSSLSFSDANCLVASAHSRSMLLSCIFDWDCWSVLDYLWCRLRGSIHFATPYGILFSWRNTAPQ